MFHVLNLLFLTCKKHKRRLYWQEWQDFNTLIQKLVGVIIFVTGPDSMDLKLRSTCASAVLQCRIYILEQKELISVFWRKFYRLIKGIVSRDWEQIQWIPSDWSEECRVAGAYFVPVLMPFSCFNLKNAWFGSFSFLCEW